MKALSCMKNENKEDMYFHNNMPYNKKENKISLKHFIFKKLLKLIFFEIISYKSYFYYNNNRTIKNKSNNKQNKNNYCILLKTKIIEYKNKIIPLLLKYFIIVNLIIQVISKKSDTNKNRNLDLLNEIIIKISGTGTQNILSPSYSKSQPYEVLINGISSSFSDKKVSNLENDENYITMKWNYKVQDCTDMFLYLTNLIEVDLSSFDASELTTMNFMFDGCKNLKSINFNNLYTPLLKNMGGSFYGCESLIYLDLSSLDTSSVSIMGSTFFNCKSLKSINLSNLDTSKVMSFEYMFYNCTSLTTIDLSHFDTSSISSISNMFS